MNLRLHSATKSLQGSLTLSRDEPLQIGKRIGAYKVLREIGRGGMGAVYLAERADGQFQKQVAIKLLKRGTDTDEVLRRFTAEKHILARLDHPNITRLLDAGTSDDGLPYFVMEYVEGQPVTCFVRDAALSILERLELFLKICAAVELAHRNRVIHRDLKPKNILVTEQGEPKLLDFGIAKLLDPDARENTAPDQQHFTPLFASPEQVRGEALTCATDVYSLGALLYEILTGQAPYHFKNSQPTRAEILRVICEHEPITPSTVVKSPRTRAQLRGDLDTIVLFAMRKEPSRRYSTVTEFVADVQCYTDRRPVRARRNTLPYRAQRFASRNRAVANHWARVAVAFCLLLTAIGLILRSNPSLRRFIGYEFDIAGRNNRIQASGPTKASVLLVDNSIAVLPLANPGRPMGNVFVSGGAQDDVLTALSKFSHLKVSSRPSAASSPVDPSRNVPQIEREPGVANNSEGSLPQLNVVVSDSAGQLAYKGVTDTNGAFATSTLSPGTYTVQFTSKRSVDTRSHSVTLVVSAGKTKVTAESVAGQKFAGGGIAMKIKVRAGTSVSGQVANTIATKAKRDNRNLVWIRPKLGSNLPGHWAAADSPEAKEAITQGTVSRKDLSDRQNQGAGMPIAAPALTYR